MGSEGLDIMTSANHNAKPTIDCLILGVRTLKDSIVASEIGNDSKLGFIRVLNSIEIELIEQKLPQPVVEDNNVRLAKQKDYPTFH